MPAEWLDVVPWILGAVAVGLTFVLFPGPAPEEGTVAEVIDLDQFRRRAAARSGRG